ncbi:hypothetical protein HGM15179_018306, partial [Zosterops borbonicus]
MEALAALAPHHIPKVSTPEDKRNNFFFNLMCVVRLHNRVWSWRDHEGVSGDHIHGMLPYYA